VLEHVDFPTDIRIGAASLPPFHTLGMYVQLLYPIASLKSVSVCAPTSYHDPTIAPVIPNAQNTIEVVQRTKATALVVVPAFLEEWVTSPHIVQLLSGLEYVVRPYPLFHLSARLKRTRSLGGFCRRASL
jgi:acyl-CoA synthetase (AMP-forming)/AMP-acid ligase II